MCSVGLTDGILMLYYVDGGIWVERDDEKYFRFLCLRDTHNDLDVFLAEFTMKYGNRTGTKQDVIDDMLEDGWADLSELYRHDLIKLADNAHTGGMQDWVPKHPVVRGEGQ